MRRRQPSDRDRVSQRRVDVHALRRDVPERVVSHRHLHERKNEKKKNLVCAHSLSQCTPPGAIPPAFTKSFAPSTIGPGSASRLTFVIAARDIGYVHNMAFTCTLPAGVTLATPAFATTDCARAVLSAPDGGTTITLSEAGLESGGDSCTVVVVVTASVPGTHSSVSGDLTSDVGNSGTASADLTVDSSLLGFTKAFSPSTVAVQQRSTLTFTLSNVFSPSSARAPTFVDVFPTGMAPAVPHNLASTCGAATLTDEQISLPGDFAFLLPAGASCTVSLDVTASGTGDNQSGDLTYFDPPFASKNAGFAVARLTVATPGDAADAVAVAFRSLPRLATRQTNCC